MPQLVKGGKLAYAWSKVGSNGEIAIPQDALKEYKLLNCRNVFLMSGSKTSGGFAITSAELLQNTPLCAFLTENPQLAAFQTPEGEAVEFRKRIFCWVKLSENGELTVPLETLEKYGVKPHRLLLSVRGSRSAIALIVRGPIIEEAKKHPDLQVY